MVDAVKLLFAMKFSRVGQNQAVLECPCVEPSVKAGQDPVGMMASKLSKKMPSDTGKRCHVRRADVGAVEIEEQNMQLMIAGERSDP